MNYSACIEWLFEDESKDFAERMRLAAHHGFSAVEFWLWSNKDLDAIEGALADSGIGLAGCVCEPMIGLNDRANHAKILDGVAASRDVAKRLGAPLLIMQAGQERTDISRSEQRSALVDCLRQAADILNGSGVRIGVEPLNTLIDHPGYLLSSTTETLDIIDEVERPEIGIVYDVYHSAVMGERTEDALEGGMHHVFHVHVADHPGRSDPGTGELDLAERLNWIFNHGYGGFVGLEYKPVAGTAQALPTAFARLEGRDMPVADRDGAHV